MMSLPAGLAIGQHHAGATGRPTHQPRVQPLRNPAPVGRQHEGNEIVDRHRGPAGPPAGRSPVGHEGHISLRLAAGPGKRHLLEPHLRQILVDAVEGRGNPYAPPGVRDCEVGRRRIGESRLGQHEGIGLARLDLRQMPCQGVQVLPRAGGKLSPEPTVDDDLPAHPFTRLKDCTVRCKPSATSTVGAQPSSARARVASR